MVAQPTDAIVAAAALIRDARSIVALSGAGISTESGIPDFRGPQGVWTKNPEAEKMATIEHYMGDPEVRMRAWQSRRTSPIWRAEPNAGHRAVAELATRSNVDLLVTQNVDGLHQKAGLPTEKLVEIHGTASEYQCMGCGDRGPMDVAIARVEAGEADPPCFHCGGILKSATISFGQSLVPEDLARSQRAAMRCDLFLGIGTTLAVYPAAELPAIALRRGAKLVILNAGETQYDRYAEIVIREPLGEVLPAIARLV